MAYEKKAASFDWLALWILLSAWASFSGWLLSALHGLNPTGVLVSFAVFFAGILLARSHLVGGVRCGGWRIFRSHHWAPRLWLALTVLAFVGGILYSPTNYDYLTYRFTRVLNWSWDGGWSWIPTNNPRVNYSGTGFEWLMVPMFVLFKTDRLFFLINFVSYLFLPGLVFSVFSRLGIAKRISWWWMWVLPCGYCYILQAASAGNDSFAAIYFLASLYYLFQGRTTSTTKNLMLSCLAIALVTGAKASNLPLVLPWFAALLFQARQVLEVRKIAVIVAALLLATVVSFLPTALLNIHYTGDYAGDPHNQGRMKISHPVSGVMGNTLQALKDNLAPPVFPHSLDWSPLVPGSWRATLSQDFPRMDLTTGELQIEENAGLGFGVVSFLALFAIAGVFIRVRNRALAVERNGRGIWIASLGTVALLAYMSKMGSEATSRLIAAYYPLAAALVLVTISIDGSVVSRRLFKGIGLLAMLSAFPLVILSPARPIFPVHAVSGLMRSAQVPAAVISRYNQVYGVYSMREDAFMDLTKSIPPEERTIGVLEMSNDPESALWRPFGIREVIEVTPDDTATALQARGIHYVIVSEDALSSQYHATLETLTSKWSASLLAEKQITLVIHRGPETWYLIRL
jgi:hypothetical protein